MRADGALTSRIQSLALAAFCAASLPLAAHACSGPGQVHVSNIFPSGEVLPENTLRLYLYFSAPMGHGEILPKLALYDRNGQLVDGAFLSNRFDLWSPDRTRLTLIFDPARVKTGLEAHEALGRALEPGGAYTLSLGRSATDAQGCHLAQAFNHSFTVGPADLSPPDPATWQIEPPVAGSTAPVTVRLGSVHDHLSMAYRIRVRTSEGAVLPGQIALLDAETGWQFHPAEPWSGREYRISVDPRLEDLAGNRPGRLFDQPIDAETEPPVLDRPFLPRSN